MTGAAVLVTRAEPGATATAAGLAELGFNPILTPVLEIRDREARADALHDAQAVLVTSANAAVRLARFGAVPTVYAVGEATAEAARAAVRGEAVSAGGDAAALAALVIARLDPEDGPLVHVRGAHVAGDLAGRLRRAGFKVGEVIAYEAETVESLAPAAVAALRAGGAAVLIHSARGAEAFLRAVERAGLTETLADAVLAGISAAALAPLENVATKRRVEAVAPTEQALLEALNHMVLRR